MTVRGVRRFVRDLLRQRRSKPFAAAPADESQLRTAIELRAAGGSGGPSAEFVDTLRERLRAELDGAEQPTAARTGQSSGQSSGQSAAQSLGQSTGQPGGSRRRFVASVAAASAASIGIGAAAARALSGGDPAVTAEPPPADQTVMPDNGEWRGVVAVKDLPEGGVRAFDAGTLVGFVHRSNGEVRAVSGVCTHLGCKLALDGPARQLNCPCHSAAFAVDGAVLHHRLPIPLAPLPKVMVRESEGVVQVFVPARPV